MEKNPVATQIAPVSQQPFRGFLFSLDVADLEKCGPCEPETEWQTAPSTSKHQPMIFAIPQKDHGSNLWFKGYFCCVPQIVHVISHSISHIFSLGFFPENAPSPVGDRQGLRTAS